MTKANLQKQSGFTLVELVVVIVLLGILGTVALGKFEVPSNDAENATFVTIDGVSMNYRNGLVRRTQNSAHVPVGTPNRNNQATRFWYMIFSAPPPVIARTDNNSVGWAMYNGVSNSGVNRSRCWKYRRAGTELAVITYEFTNGTTTLVKNF